MLCKCHVAPVHLSIEDTVQGKVFSVVSILSLSYFKPGFSRPTKKDNRKHIQCRSIVSSENKCRRKRRKKNMEKVLLFSIG